MGTKGYVWIRNDHQHAPYRTKKSICNRKNYNINFIPRIGLELRFLRCGIIRCYKKRFSSQARGWVKAIRPEDRLELTESNCPSMRISLYAHPNTDELIVQASEDRTNSPLGEVGRVLSISPRNLLLSK